MPLIFGLVVLSLGPKAFLYSPIVHVVVYALVLTVRYSFGYQMRAIVNEDGPARQQPRVGAAYAASDASALVWLDRFCIHQNKEKDEGRARLNKHGVRSFEEMLEHRSEKMLVLSLPDS